LSWLQRYKKDEKVGRHNKAHPLTQITAPAIRQTAASCPGLHQIARESTKGLQVSALMAKTEERLFASKPPFPEG